MKNKNKRVLVGISGGIDSTAACILLQEQGFEVIGLTLQVWGEAPAEAKEVANKLGIEHHIIDEREVFQQTIIQSFIDEYRLGKTPNPCVMCNPLFKFRVLTEWADQLNCQWISTGHYIRIVEKNNHFYLQIGADSKKDQSYFLWRVGQEVLKRTIFPLGNYLKTDVREYLRTKGFEKKSQGGESMEVCFIQSDYRDFLKEQCPDIDNQIGSGWFVNKKGEKLGEHKGFPYYTIGQRKGLGIALGEPAYVIKLNPEKNTVMLGKEEDLLSYHMLTEAPEVVSKEEFLSCTNLSVRIRYRSKPIPCSVKFLEDNRLLVTFKQPASAITPGQSAVFYDGDRVLGGAIIDFQRGLQWIIEQQKN